MSDPVALDARCPHCPTTWPSADYEVTSLEVVKQVAGEVAEHALAEHGDFELHDRLIAWIDQDHAQMEAETDELVRNALWRIDAFSGAGDAS